MIRSLRAYFLARALREKLLLLAFVAIGLLWWASAFSTRGGTFWRQQRATRAQLAEQNEWIRNRTAIEANATKAAAQLDATKTLNANQLATTLQQLANEAGFREHGLNGTPTTTRSGQFAIHTAVYTIRRAEWASIVRFYEALLRRSPYIAVDQFNLNAPVNAPAGNAPEQLTLALRAESVEILR
jgi:hypothetical protein